MTNTSRYVPRLVKILEHQHPEYTGRIRHAIHDTEMDCFLVCGAAVDDDNPNGDDPSFRDQLLSDILAGTGTMAQWFMGEGKRDWAHGYMVEIVDDPIGKFSTMLGE